MKRGKCRNYELFNGEYFFFFFLQCRRFLVQLSFRLYSCLTPFLISSIPLSLSYLQVLVNGAEHVNRAMEGDLVAIEILPMDQWASSKSTTGKGGKEGDANKSNKKGADDDEGSDDDEDDANKGAEISEPTAAPAMGDLENVVSEKGGGAALLQPAGRVVGIVRRAWKHYCGSIAQFKADEALVREMKREGEREMRSLTRTRSGREWG